MESFFLAETTKYLYLLFDTDNFIHNQGQHGTVINTPNGECVIEAGGYIFNTEAHPVDPAALYCCSEVPSLQLYDLAKLNSNKNLFRGDSIELRRHKMHDKQKNSKQNNKNETEECAKNVTTKEETENVHEPVEIVKFATQRTMNEETGTGTYENDDISLPDKIQTVSTVATEINESESTKELFREDVEDKFKILPEFVNQFLSQTQNMRPKFDPQRMLERLRADTRYSYNASWETNYQLLSCEAQPFLQKISLLGEFFNT